MVGQVAAYTFCCHLNWTSIVICAPQDTQIKIERMLRAIGKQSLANLKPRVFLDKSASKPAENEKVIEKR